MKRSPTFDPTVGPTPAPSLPAVDQEAFYANIVLFSLMLLGSLWAWRQRTRRTNGSPSSSLVSGAAGSEAATEWRPDVETLERLATFPRNVALACVLRLAWLILSVAKASWSQYDEQERCKDPHVFVAALGRLCQLVVFSNFFSLLVFWWEMCLDDERRSTGGLRGEVRSELASVLARSTARVVRVVRSVGGRLVYRRADRAGGGGLAASLLDGGDASAVTDAQQLYPDMLMAPRTLQLLIEFWAYFVLLVLFVSERFSCSPEARRRIGEATNVTLSLAFLVLAIGYLSIGLRLRAKVSHAFPSVRSAVLAVTITAFSLFLFKTILFLLVPVGGVHLVGLAQEILYPWFYYTAPELVPAAMIIMLTRRAGSVNVSPTMVNRNTSGEAGALLR